jgi:hypothetical protein
MSTSTRRTAIINVPYVATARGASRAAERRAHDVSLANQCPETAGQRADLRPCVLCGTRDHGGELGPAIGRSGAPLDGVCTPCARAAWDQAAHRAAFAAGLEDSADGERSDAAW